MTNPRIVSVVAERPYHLRVQWDNGAITSHDFASAVATKRWATALRGADVFSRVVVLERGLEIGWRGTDIQLSADGLWEDIHPRAPVAKWMSPDEFRSWQYEMGWSWDQTAHQLDISRRTIGYYLDGSQEIPKAIWLACMHLVSQRRRAVRPRPPVLLTLAAGVSASVIVDTIYVVDDYSNARMLPLFTRTEFPVSETSVKLMSAVA